MAFAIDNRGQVAGVSDSLTTTSFTPSCGPDRQACWTSVSSPETRSVPFKHERSGRRPRGVHNRTRTPQAATQELLTHRLPHQRISMARRPHERPYPLHAPAFRCSPAGCVVLKGIDVGTSVSNKSPTQSFTGEGSPLIEEHVVLHRLNSAATLIQRTTTEAPRDICITSDWTYIRRRSTTA